MQQPSSQPHGPSFESTPGRSDGIEECLTIDSPDIDVQQVMRRIRESIESKRAAGILREEPWLSRRLDLANLPGSARRNADKLALLQLAGRIELEGEPIKSHRPIVGPLINFVKRVTRFWTRKYTDPIFIRQGHFNSEILEILNDLVRENQELERRLDALEQQLATSTSTDNPPSETSARA